ncbi:MAG: zinc metallopeptidase [Defluviitaleaceae bacterium]|nr:zinc metallopeptidase [Defluviitaleaceae bacterium]
MFFDWTVVLLIPAVILAMFAQAKVSGNLKKFSKAPMMGKMNGAAVAAKILEDHGIRDVTIERLSEKQAWGDHYDPKAKAIRLSPHVYDTNSISAVAVAAHEVGHAIQHNEGYTPLVVRSGMFPAVRISSGAAFPLLFAGLILGMMGFIAPQFASLLINIGIILFTVVVLFQIVTLPVEFNASRRAMEILESGRYFNNDAEARGAKKVLSAAAMTYVAAAAMAVTQLIRFLIIASQNR